MRHDDRTMGYVALAKRDVEVNHFWVIGHGAGVGTRLEIRAYLKAIY